MFGCHLQVVECSGHTVCKRCGHCIKFVHYHYWRNVDCVFLVGKGEIEMWKDLNPFLVCLRYGMEYFEVERDVWDVGYRKFYL